MRDKVKPREMFAWFFVVVLTGTSMVWSHHQTETARQRDAATQLLNECIVDKEHAGELIIECADDLTAKSKLCSQQGAMAMERAVQLFECEKSQCEKGGWLPPPDWEETEEVLGAFAEKQ